MMTPKTLEEIKNNKIIKQRLAKVMALQCFRNTKLEDLHVGTSPDSKAGDFSDVKIVSPYGEIPWDNLARFNDDEMKELMIDAVNHCYHFLQMLFDDPQGDEIIALLKTTDVKKEWQDPTGIS